MDRFADPMLESVLQPMRDLLIRYRRLSTAVEQAIGALEGGLGGRDDSIQDPKPIQLASLEAHSSEVDTLLEFQERLSELPGVLKVTMAGAKSGRSSFIVELAATAQLVVCSSCGKTLVEGAPPASHGLCEDCRAKFGQRPG